MKKTYAITNLVVIAAVIAWNYIANALGINGNSIGSLSDTYNSLFTPAGYAFSIWGIIFLGLIALGIYMVQSAFRDGKEAAYIGKLGPWLLLANLANATWVYVWLKELPGVSVLVMLVILVSLIVIIVKLGMEKEIVPRGQVIWIWWPLGIYSGWIAVATIANISAYLSHSGWEFLFGEVTWTVVLILLAVVLNATMVLVRRMRDFAFVGIWSLLAIWARHRGEIQEIAWTALAGALVIALTIGFLSLSGKLRTGASGN